MRPHHFCWQHHSVGLIGSSLLSLFCVIGDVSNFQSCFVSSFFLRKTNYWAGVSCRPLSNFHQLSRPPGAFQQDEWCITWHFHPSGSQNRSFHSMLKKSEKVPFFIRILHHHQKLKSIVKYISSFFLEQKANDKKFCFFATMIEICFFTIFFLIFEHSVGAHTKTIIIVTTRIFHPFPSICYYMLMSLVLQEL